jgi:hypothetical protein
MGGDKNTAVQGHCGVLPLEQERWGRKMVTLNSAPLIYIGSRVDAIADTRC